MDQSSYSELDWMSRIMHGTEYWGRGLIVPCGRDGTVRNFAYGSINILRKTRWESPKILRYILKRGRGPLKISRGGMGYDLPDIGVLRNMFVFPIVKNQFDRPTVHLRGIRMFVNLDVCSMPLTFEEKPSVCETLKKTTFLSIVPTNLNFIIILFTNPRITYHQLERSLPYTWVQKGRGGVVSFIRKGMRCDWGDLWWNAASTIHQA